jgi:hypothetical protein
MAGEACGVHLAEVWLPVSHATARALSALKAEHALRADAGRVLRPARPVVGCVA